LEHEYDLFRISIQDENYAGGGVAMNIFFVKVKFIETPL
jgi:hypothetical protein